MKITRRCHDRRLFLTPAGAPNKGLTPEKSENFYGYTLARAVLKYGVQFHGATQMGNHHHIDITDVLGNRPDFKNSIHSNLARGLNARLGRFDSVWSGGDSCDTVSPSDDDLADRLPTRNPRFCSFRPRDLESGTSPFRLCSIAISCKW